MLFALNKEGKRVYIDDSLAGVDYFCPCPSCGEKLIARKGQINAHHFAHRPNTKCTDSWHHEDMSPWHIYWQSLFPAETQEIYKEKDGQSHRADVLIEKTKTVLEFQHSPLSIEEFDDRNSFYNSLGYKVIWVFDLIDKFDEGKLENYSRDLFSWSYPKKTFAHFDVKKQRGKVELYFQLKIEASKNDALKDLIKLKQSGYPLGEQDRHYIYEHEDDENELVKVVWSTGDGFSRFATDGYFYSERDVVDLYFQSIQEDKKPLD